MSRRTRSEQHAIDAAEIEGANGVQRAFVEIFQLVESNPQRAFDLLAELFDGWPEGDDLRVACDALGLTAVYAREAGYT